ncbi:lysosomal Pro-X carboxypeptidase [Selaginella moellendorffii]|uniref:lysosomal Pro-X carboxypeptidase n=1 Tax=Selaginella moellendorffii TaxID=88036 RepID=UPI000D1CB65C|nr:lysosomal Pro-X carboxypeptidase [Selaginella moellendorffii]|eukprot:XP_024544110.1 lysosomal Pro-X carboxypeptidase [Selaginella moellendorffii]
MARSCAHLLLAAIAVLIQVNAKEWRTGTHHHHRMQSPRRGAALPLALKEGFAYTEHYFQQTLDHFNVGNITLFPQRYLLHNASWSGGASGAPIFVYCGNEGDIVWFAENTGFMFDIAPLFGALLVFPEHRFYGKSQPFGGQNGPKELAFCSAEQALADFATLILDLKRNLSAQASPVVVFGGSYGGMLAAWFRLKYPHIAIGALASSAPILQFENIVPYTTFYDIVSNAFKREGEKCFEIIRNSWTAITEAAEQQNGLRNLSQDFHMCSDFKNADELINWLESAYSYLAMANYPYAANFTMPLPAHPVRKVCQAMVNSPVASSILQRIYAGVNVYYNFTGAAKCFDLDDDPHGLSGWNWQSCTEMVMPMSSNSNTSMYPPFEWDGEAWSRFCWENYGAIPRPSWVTTEFGGHDIKSVLRNFGSNIVFSNGLLDPWSGGSVLESISSTILAFVTKEGAHHLDFRWSRKDDPQWLIEQRESEVREIKRWLSEYHQNVFVI